MELNEELAYLHGCKRNSWPWRILQYFFLLTRRLLVAGPTTHSFTTLFCTNLSAITRACVSPCSYLPHNITHTANMPTADDPVTAVQTAINGLKVRRLLHCLSSTARYSMVSYSNRRDVD